MLKRTFVKTYALRSTMATVVGCYDSKENYGLVKNPCKDCKHRLFKLIIGYCLKNLEYGSFEFL